MKLTYVNYYVILTSGDYMNRCDLLYKYIGSIKRRGLLTEFIKGIFNYDNFYDYNYLFRMTKDKDRVIIDIYDNISVNRFNRYIFIFGDISDNFFVKEEDNVFVTYIYVKKIVNCGSKLKKLAYLFSLEDGDMIKYAKTFLDIRFVVILENMLNKFIYQ